MLEGLSHISATAPPRKKKSFEYFSIIWTVYRVQRDMVYVFLINIYNYIYMLALRI